MIALVSKDIQSLGDLKEKKFCHPGINLQSSEWTRIFVNFFQYWITPKKCEPDETLIENEFSSLAEYFYSACIPGPWVPNINEDNRLKNKYQNLHSLCENPTGRSITDDAYYGREGVLRCLIDGIGNVAWIRLDDQLYFSKTSQLNLSLYNYVCPDGSSRPAYNSQPCIWISRPWPVIISQRNVAEKVSTLIRNMLDKSLRMHENLMQAMELYHVSPVALDSLKTPRDYINQFNGFASANMRAPCRPSRDIKWCTASTIENKKCKWMSNIAISFGIQPALSCLQLDKRDECIDAVKNGQSELFIVSPDELTVAYKKSLTSLVQVMPKEIKDLNTIGIFVKNNSKLWNIEDLRGTRVCFPSYLGFEWDAFISVMRSGIVSKDKNNIQIDSIWRYTDDEAMNHFFKEIIISSDVKKNNDENNNYDPIESTYQCLISGRGDVAIISILYSQIMFYKTQYKLRNICVDHTNNEESNECLLTWVPLAAVMVNTNMTQLRRIEIKTMLSLMDESFGVEKHNMNPSFLLYGSFNHENNIIFPMNTHYLQENINEKFHLPRNYITILEQIQSRKELSINNSSILYMKMEIVFILMLLLIISISSLNN